MRLHLQINDKVSFKGNAYARLCGNGCMARRWRKAGVRVIKLITTGSRMPPITALIEVTAAAGPCILSKQNRGEKTFICMFLLLGSVI